MALPSLGGLLGAAVILAVLVALLGAISRWLGLLLGAFAELVALVLPFLVDLSFALVLLAVRAGSPSPFAATFFDFAIRASSIFFFLSSLDLFLALNALSFLLRTPFTLINFRSKTLTIFPSTDFFQPID